MEEYKTEFGFINYDFIVNNNYKLLHNFDMYFVAQQYIDVIEGKDTGYLGKYEIGKPTVKFIEKAEKQWYGTGDKRTFNFKNIL